MSEIRLRKSITKSSSRYEIRLREEESRMREIYNTYVLLIVFVFGVLGIILLGAAFGYLLVRKYIISEDGEVDVGVAQFIKWSMCIVAVTCIILSTKDTPLSMEPLSWLVGSEVLVVDPPRKGLDPSLISALQAIKSAEHKAMTLESPTFKAKDEKRPWIYVQEKILLRFQSECLAGDMTFISDANGLNSTSISAGHLSCMLKRYTVDINGGFESYSLSSSDSKAKPDKDVEAVTDAIIDTCTFRAKPEMGPNATSEQLQNLISLPISGNLHRRSTQEITAGHHYPPLSFVPVLCLSKNSPALKPCFARTM
ncbi:hypothetical protein L2E82_50848 [Cichorium intybus]|nr:hypothetical protein L2E82_50848 [Cichorium intybus]